MTSPELPGALAFGGQVRPLDSPRPNTARPEVNGILSQDDPRRNIVIACILELRGGARIDAVVELRRRIRDEGAAPVFVTDHPDFALFAIDRTLYEYLPSISEQLKFAPGRPWDVYVATKVKLWLAKWRPVSIISKGTTIELFIEKISVAHSQYG